MLSFKVITEDNRKELLKAFGDELGADAAAIAEEITESFLASDEVEFAVSLFGDCLLVRVFDMGRYTFLYPFELTANADIGKCIIKISEYAMREELPLAFSDVPAESLSEFSVFRHMDIDAEDLYGESFSVKIKTECMLLDKIPEVDEGRVKLTAISEKDIPLYAELSRSQNVNKYWGYNYSEDVCAPSDEYFYEAAARDFATGTALSLAVRCDGEFCGEAVIYAFDGMGVAEFAIRLLPECQGKGLGRATVRAVISLARNIGLVKLRSVIMKENEKSLAMLDAFTNNRESVGESFMYTIELA